MPKCIFKYQCSLCLYHSNSRGNALRHIESLHFKGLFTYSCDKCEHVSMSENAHNSHMRNIHRNRK